MAGKWKLKAPTYEIWHKLKLPVHTVRTYIHTVQEEYVHDNEYMIRRIEKTFPKKLLLAARDRSFSSNFSESTVKNLIIKELAWYQ